MGEKYSFDPQHKLTLKDINELFRFIFVEIDESAYWKAPESVRKMFRPSIMSNGPGRKMN